MPITHTSRTDKTYYLHQKPDKKGRLRYFFSKDEEGNLVEAIPDGYEVYENVHGQVFLRKKVQQVITDAELKTVLLALKKHSPDEWRYKAEIKQDAIVIYEASQDWDGLEKLAPFAQSFSDDYKKQRTTYTEMMRFVLAGTATRFFYPERMCFIGEEDWMGIGSAGDLTDVASEYIKYLGTEELFELF